MHYRTTSSYYDTLNKKNTANLSCISDVNSVSINDNNNRLNTYAYNDISNYSNASNMFNNHNLYNRNNNLEASILEIEENLNQSNFDMWVNDIYGYSIEELKQYNFSQQEKQDLIIKIEGLITYIEEFHFLHEKSNNKLSKYIDAFNLVRNKYIEIKHILIRSEESHQAKDEQILFFSNSMMKLENENSNLRVKIDNMRKGREYNDDNFDFKLNRQDDGCRNVVNVFHHNSDSDDNLNCKGYKKNYDENNSDKNDNESYFNDKNDNNNDTKNDNELDMSDNRNNNIDEVSDIAFNKDLSIEEKINKLSDLVSNKNNHIASLEKDINRYSDIMDNYLKEIDILRNKNSYIEEELREYRSKLFENIDICNLNNNNIKVDDDKVLCDIHNSQDYFNNSVNSKHSNNNIENNDNDSNISICSNPNNISNNHLTNLSKLTLTNNNTTKTNFNNNTTLATSNLNNLNTTREKLNKNNSFINIQENNEDENIENTSSRVNHNSNFCNNIDTKKTIFSVLKSKSMRLDLFNNNNNSNSNRKGLNNQTNSGFLSSTSKYRQNNIGIKRYSSNKTNSYNQNSSLNNNLSNKYYTTFFSHLNKKNSGINTQIIDGKNINTLKNIKNIKNSQTTNILSNRLMPNNNNNNIDTKQRTFFNYFNLKPNLLSSKETVRIKRHYSTKIKRNSKNSLINANSILNKITESNNIYTNEVNGNNFNMPKLKFKYSNNYNPNANLVKKRNSNKFQANPNSFKSFRSNNNHYSSNLVKNTNNNINNNNFYYSFRLDGNNINNYNNNYNSNANNNANIYYCPNEVITEILGTEETGYNNRKSSQFNNSNKNSKYAENKATIKYCINCFKEIIPPFIVSQVQESFSILNNNSNVSESSKRNSHHQRAKTHFYTNKNKINNFEQNAIKLSTIFNNQSYLSEHTDNTEDYKNNNLNNLHHINNNTYIIGDIKTSSQSNSITTSPNLGLKAIDQICGLDYFMNEDQNKNLSSPIKQRLSNLTYNSHSNSNRDSNSKETCIKLNKLSELSNLSKKNSLNTNTNTTRIEKKYSIIIREEANQGNYQKKDNNTIVIGECNFSIFAVYCYNHIQSSLANINNNINNYFNICGNNISNNNSETGKNDKATTKSFIKFENKLLIRELTQNFLITSKTSTDDNLIKKTNKNHEIAKSSKSKASINDDNDNTTNAKIKVKTKQSSLNEINKQSNHSNETNNNISNNDISFNSFKDARLIYKKYFKHNKFSLI